MYNIGYIESVNEMHQMSTCTDYPPICLSAGGHLKSKVCMRFCWLCRTVQAAHGQRSTSNFAACSYTEKISFKIPLYSIDLIRLRQGNWVNGPSQEIELGHTVNRVHINLENCYER